MDSDQGKLFVGGISWETTEEKLKDYFGQYGDVYQVNIMRDKATGRPRGFGFVLFSDPSVLDRVLQDKHTIDGRPVEAKRAMSREEQQSSGRTGNNNGGRSGGGGGNFRTKKIFVGGLPPTLTDDGFRQYFENYGQVTDVVIMYDQNTERPRGFGFISFDNEDAVDRVLQNTFHDLNGKQVEVKRALPKDANPGMGGRGGGGGYNSSGGQNAYGGRMDSNSFMQSQSAGGAFPGYGSSGYGAAGYGYGPANTGMGYGGYAGYGGANPGYGGPASAAAYGNPNANAQRSSWNAAQAASGYGAAGYGSAGPWAAGAGSGGPTGQSPSGASGYGNQGYGYGNYGGSDGYGSVGNRAGGAPGSNAAGGGGEMQGGYGDANGHGGYGAGGYGAQANGPHGAQMGYGGGYGGARQAQ
ncbi:heterogeneous nuclear ribonucleoprotein 1-like [Chenopodium quinoa]|uniref:heterogeneous nuclear ribonucleoprotein 1-like n=1 Tax=Chenopodium quinoa TaxID=63459 RepID=UPI000B78CB83|nr:heterogeneous nuclear ribonucleoprotein 1-like [Chenopodium quinoa]